MCLCWAGRRSVLASCRLFPSPAIALQTIAFAPAVSSPHSSPPSVKEVRRSWSKLFPSLLFFVKLSTKNAVLFSCSEGRKSSREISSRNTLGWQSMQTSLFQLFWTLLYFSLFSIHKLSVFLRETMGPFLALEDVCRNYLGAISTAPCVSDELLIYTTGFSG